jgi:Reverse transcriptase (RNA-dependent DNA polymerase)
MSLHLIKPHYPCEPIRSVSKLATALRIDEATLTKLSARANAMYRDNPIRKAGKTRLTFDAQGLLKVVHERIRVRIFSRVRFPAYLHGSLKGCDYVTNAALHTNKKIIICEDVESFFPSVRSNLVMDVWQNFFLFSEDVARLLTALTTKDDAIPQGAKTSSYLANLVFWRAEPYLQARLANEGITYSRYVDDIAMSSKFFMSKPVQTKVIAMVYGMLRKHGLSASRKKGKHQVFSDSGVMKVTKLIVNRKPSLPRQKRSNIRAQVHSATTQFESMSALNNAAQMVGQLGRFHPTEAAALKRQIKKMKASQPVNSFEQDPHNSATAPEQVF